MRTRPLLAALLAVLPALALADVAVPDTPAGHVFSAWLEAFNSDDLARLEAFTRKYQPGKNPDGLKGWKADTGPYDLLEVFSHDRRTVFFHVKSKNNGTEEVGRLTVTTSAPLSVSELGSWRIPAGAKIDVVALDARARARIVGRVAKEFESSYVLPDVGNRIAAALRAHEKRGDYRAAVYGQDLARQLTDDLLEVSHDRHAEVRFSFVAQPAGVTAQDRQKDIRRFAANNCGFEKAEHLRPNIGYLKFNVFADAEVCGPTASAAMTLVADSDVLIIDLRDNRGGGGGMVEYIASFLFAERTHLEDMYSRLDDSTTETWTPTAVPGRKFIGKPVYLLTSHQTFSAAESLTYALKNLERATLVGETTLGGAHPTEARTIEEHFVVRVPYARSISPITGTNWEGTGIEPDVKVPAADALEVALKLATEKLAGSGHDR